MSGWRLVVLLAIAVISHACFTIAPPTSGIDASPFPGPDRDSSPAGTGGSAGVPPDAAPDADPPDGGVVTSCHSDEPRSPLACGQPACAGSRACCAVSGTCCAPTPSPAFEPIAFRRCTGSDPRECVAGSVPFGAAHVSAESGRFLPTGSDVLDGGLFLPRDLNPNEQVSLRATLTAPVGDGCGPDCLEVIGLGFTTASPSSKNLRVAPVVALLLTASRARMVLVTGITTLWEAPVDAKPHQFELTLKPDGGVSLTVDGKRAPVPAGRVDRPAAPLRAILYGRNVSQLPELQHASADDVVLLTTPCGDPTRWQPTLQLWPSTALLARRAPSLGSYADGVALAYESDDGIHFAAAKDFSLLLAQPRPDPVVLAAAAVPFARGRLEHPELVWSAGGWVLYFSVIDLSGRRSIGRARSNGELFVGAEEVVAAASVGMDELDGPSVLEQGDRTLLVVRGRSGTDTSLLLFEELSAAADASSVREFKLVRTIAEPSTDTKAFDASWVGTGDLVFAERAFQLYYGGRGSATTAIGLQAADDLDHWTGKRVALGPTAGGFDTLGVTDPDVAVRNAIMYMVFVTGDAKTSRIGWTSRPILPF